MVCWNFICHSILECSFACPTIGSRNMSHAFPYIPESRLTRWSRAVTFGENYPDAEVIATDISASQPIDVPPNVDFQIDDINSDWTYTDPFDFIHMRGLSGASFDWPKIYAQAYQHLEKDGQIEIADWGPIKLDNQPKDSYLSIYNAALQSAMEKAGTGIWLEHLKKPLLESAGFSILKSMTIEVPLGTWSRDRRKIGLGKMAMISALEGLEANSLRLLTKELGWKPEEVQDLCMKVKQELLSPGAKASLPCQFIIARKLFTP